VAVSHILFEADATALLEHMAGVAAETLFVLQCTALCGNLVILLISLSG